VFAGGCPALRLPHPCGQVYLLLQEKMIVWAVIIRPYVGAHDAHFVRILHLWYVTAKPCRPSLATLQPLKA